MVMRRPLHVAFLLLAACGAPPAQATPQPVQTDRVAVAEPAGRPDEWGYSPAAVRVASGTSVTWHNGGVEFHTVTSDDVGRPFDVALEVGKDASVTFARAGSFAYHCGVHPQMKGVVVVCDGACR
jgi:plastocyanin